MHTTHRAQAVHVIDSAIRDLEQLRQSLLSGGDDDLSDETLVDPALATSIAQQMTEYWTGHDADGFYRGSGFVIDLKDVEGRAQMLVLANLLAAKTTEAVAERTFLQLGDAGLLRHERLAAGRPEDRALALRILQETYKAVTDKVVKVEVIYNNQARLATAWNCDLNNIYETFGGVDHQVIGELQSFAHLQRRALWLAREMKVCGVWPELGPQATGYYDGHVRRVLNRLNLAQSTEANWPASRKECMAIADQWFDGDLVPLYLHGSRLCIHNDRSLCGGTCPVKENCTFWGGGSEQSAGDSVD